MALKKEIRIGEELEFSLTHEAQGPEIVRMKLTEVVGRKAILVITADKGAVPVRHIKQEYGSEQRGKETFPR
jgi:hypothetical protein